MPAIKEVSDFVVEAWQSISPKIIQKSFLGLWTTAESQLIIAKNHHFESNELFDDE